MVRSLLLVALLLVTGCTAQPVSAPPPTSPPTAGEPVEPAPEDPKNSCIPAGLISEATGNPTPDPMPAAGRPLGLLRCTYHGGTTKLSRIEFTTESDEESFAQRRDEYVRMRGAVGDLMQDRLDFFDEAYETWDVCCESLSQNVIAARHGSIEVWVSWTLPVAEDHREGFRESLFTKIFERLA